MPQRTEPRVAKEAPIRVFGMDSHGRPVNLTATTIDVSQHGARVSGVQSWTAPGETIGVRYGTEKARYKIVWVGTPGTPTEGQLGLRCMEAGKYIWGTAPVVPADTQPAGDPFPPRSLGLQAPLPPVAVPALDIRRREQRYNVSGGANVREAGKNVPQWTTLQDLSLGGCYVETTAPLPTFTRVEITIHVGDTKVDARGTVTVKHPLIGMGIQFTEMTPLNRERLRQLISAIQRSQSSASSGH